MSGSEKYREARLAEQRERQLREERARLAALEEAKRLAEERRRAAARLEKSRSALVLSIRGESARLATHEGTEGGREVARELRELAGRLGDLSSRAGGAADEATVGRLASELAKQSAELGDLIALGESRRLSRLVAKEEAELGAIAARFAEMDAKHSDKFDAPGRSEVSTLLASARESLAAKDLTRASPQVAAARESLARHRKEVDTRFTAWDSARRAAVQAVEGAGEKVAGLRVDDVCMFWAADVIDDLEGTIRGAREDVADERFDEAVGRSSAVLARIREILPEIQENQLQKEIQDYIVHGVGRVLEGMGFIVKDAFPDPSCPTHPQAPKILQAKRIDGRTLAVSVPQGDEIHFSVGGFPTRVVTSTRGEPARTCSEAVEQIDLMSDTLRDAFGVVSGELMWEGKDPHLIMKGEDQLPEGETTTRQNY
jgi:hypothetical protein